MISIEEMIREEIRLRKEESAQRARDDYKKQLEASFGLDFKMNNEESTTPAAVVATTTPSPRAATSAESFSTVPPVEDISENVATSLSVAVPVSTTTAPPVVTVTPLPVEDRVTVPLLEEVAKDLATLPVTESTVTETPASSVAVTAHEPSTTSAPAVDAPAVVTSTLVPVITDYPPMRAATFNRPTLSQVREKVYRERGLMFDENIIVPADPTDSRRLDRPSGRATRRKTPVVSTTTVSPDLEDFRRVVEEEKQLVLKKKAERDAKKKSEDLATLAYEMAKAATPVQIPVPAMPGFPEVLDIPMATDPTLLVPLDTDSRATKESSGLLIIDLQTVKGRVMTAGLLGAGMYIRVLFCSLLI